jgi:hypothetical protein
MLVVGHSIIKNNLPLVNTPSRTSEMNAEHEFGGLYGSST